MKRAVLCLVLALLLCPPGFANSSSTGYTWEQYKAKKAGQTLVPTEGQKSVKRGTYQSSVTSSLPDDNSFDFEYWFSTVRDQIVIAWHWSLAHYKVILIGALAIFCIASIPRLARKWRAWKLEETEHRLKEAERRARIEEEYQRKHDLYVRLSKPSYDLAKLPLVDGDQPVFVTLSGVKYHREHCGVVTDYSYSKFKVGLSVALHHGYAPCSRCCAGMPQPEIYRGPVPAENPRDAVLSVVEPMIEHFYDTYLQYIRSYHARLVKDRNDYIASLSPEELEDFKSLRISYRSPFDPQSDDNLLALPPLSLISDISYRELLLPIAHEQYCLAAKQCLNELAEEHKAQRIRESEEAIRSSIAAYKSRTKAKQSD